MNYILPALAVILGYLFVVLIKPSSKGNLKLLLAFSGAFLLAITIFHLLPEFFAHTDKSHNFGFKPSPVKSGVYIIAGILLQIILEFFSKGAEHGHVHKSDASRAFPWLLFISLSIHAFLEGFPIHHHEEVLLGVVVHKLPIAIILSTFFIESNQKRVYTLLFLILFACMTPLGTLVEQYVPIVKTYYFQISGVVIGIFLHVSTTILFESTEGHKFNINKLICIFLGVIIAYFI